MKYNIEQLGEYIEVLSGFAFKSKDLPIIQKSLGRTALLAENPIRISF